LDLKVKVSAQGQSQIQGEAYLLSPSVGPIQEGIGDMNGNIRGYANLVSGVVGGADVHILATGPPGLTISAPTAGQRITAAGDQLTVLGSVTGYTSGIRVLYQLNDLAWASATTTNDGKKWSATVTMQPGTNVLRAYATDVANRTSPTRSVTFQYVVTAPLALHIEGRGTVTGAANGQMLEIGRKYSLVAYARTGFAFKTWCCNEGWTTNRATLRFIMHSGLQLTATFVDVQVPTLTIAYPTNSMRIRTNDLWVTITGKAKDNVGVTQVWCQMNGGIWATAATGNGWTNWSVVANMISGTNRFRAYSVDSAGNCSLTKTVTFRNVAASPKHLATSVELQIISWDPVTGAGLRLKGTPGATYTIEVSADLIEWKPLKTVTCTAESENLSDPSAAGCAARFYRVSSGLATGP
jgi:hypothetical protein